VHVLKDIRKSTAAILVAQNSPLIIDSIELPDNLDYGQVLVRVHYSGICGSQLGEITGVKGADHFLPHLLGHEGAGEVLEIGAHVNHVQEGDKVVMHWRPGKGIESKPPKYRWKGQILNAGFVTTFNEYAVVSENRLTRLPEGYPLELAPLYGCAVTTGLGVIENNAQLCMGESIVVVGAGGVGLNILQGALLHSAYPIVAIDHFENRLALAKQVGATHVLNNQNNPDWPQQVLTIIGETGADVVVDNTGNPEVISQCYELTKSKGRTILVGVPAKGKETKLYTLPLHFGKVFTGTHGGNGNPSDDIPRYMQLEELGRLKLKKLFTERFTLEKINHAIERMRSGNLAGRGLVVMVD
jgi:S-(hydroxymethyl)glutathione dehydrogenase / alcohol dehydrogenase